MYDSLKRRFRLYSSLSKPRITFMVTFSCAVGYFLANGRIDSILLFLTTLIGTAACSAGASALNCYLERDVDAQMHRTQKRPLPTRQIAPSDALLFGIILVLGGTSLLATQVNLLCGFLALLTAFLYVLVYTPLKRVTWLNTFVGAIPGALPPLGGWAAASDRLEFGGWVLFLILFLWQHPHFYAIAWMYREDYRRAGFQMLPVIDPDGRRTIRQILLYSVLLLVISCLPFLIGMSGVWYLYGSLFLGFVMLLSGVTLARSHSAKDARMLLRTSVAYLPLLYILILIDR